MIKSIIFCVLFILFVCILLYMCGDLYIYNKRLEINKATTPTTIIGLGVVQGKQEVEIRSEISGVVKEVFVVEGQEVKSGDRLLQLEDTEFLCKTKIAQANLLLSQYQLQRLINGDDNKEEIKQNIAVYKRKKSILKNPAIIIRRVNSVTLFSVLSVMEKFFNRNIRKELRHLKNALIARRNFLKSPARQDDIKIGESFVKINKLKEQICRIDESRTLLLSPMNGVITTKNVEVGQFLQKDREEPPIIITDMSSYTIKGFIDEQHISKIHIGLSLKIGNVCTGKIVYISPRMERKTVISNNPDEWYDTQTQSILITLNKPLLIGSRFNLSIIQ